MKRLDLPSKDENNTLFIIMDATMTRLLWPCYWLNNNRRTNPAAAITPAPVHDGLGTLHAVARDTRRRLGYSSFHMATGQFPHISSSGLSKVWSSIVFRERV